MLSVTFLLIILSIFCIFLASYIKAIRTGDPNENNLTYWMFSTQALSTVKACGPFSWT